MSYLSLFLLPFFLLTNAVFPTPEATPVEIHEAAKTSLEELVSSYDGFLLDAYGVFWGSKDLGVIPGAAEAMKYLVSCGKLVGILSNSTQLAAKEKEKLAKHGLEEGVHYHFLLTSGELAKEILTSESLPFPTPNRTFWLFGSIHPHFGSHRQIFEGTNYRQTENLEEADFIYISIPHIDGLDQEDPEVFRETVKMASGKTPVLCVNPDRFGLEGIPPRNVVRQGSIASLFSENQVPVHWIGKPSKIIFEAALRRFPSHLSKEKILMIGDTPETDIRGARGIGIDAALVTKTGIMAKAIENEGSSLLQRLPETDQPNFLLDRLGLTKEDSASLR